MVEKSSSVGSSPQRKDDIRHVKGEGYFVDDMEEEGMLHVSIARSPHAHARIVDVDTSKAEEMEGVVEVLTGEDAEEIITEYLTGIDLTEVGMEMKVPPFYGLASDKVRYHGEPVAAVAAESLRIAEDACELIDIDYEPLPPVLTVEDSRKEDAPLLWDEWEDNLQFKTEREVGDVDDAFEESEHRIEAKLNTNAYSAATLEGRAIIARYMGGELTVHGSFQAPYIARTAISQALGIDEEKVHIISKDIGGAFGQKLHVEQDIVPIMLALKTNGRPVKWVERRDENLMARHGTRDYSYELKMGFDDDYKIKALDVNILGNMGPDGCTRTASVGQYAVAQANSSQAYKVPNWRGAAECYVTTKGPTSAYRGYGKDTANFGIERLLNIASLELDVDPIELRKRNFIQPEEFPYRTVTGALYDSGNFPRLADRAKELSNYKEWREKQEELREEGRLIGVGVAHMIEPNGAAVPYCVYNGWASADIRVGADGGVKVTTDEKDLGQGTRTTMAQIVSDELGVKLEDVEVLEGDTDQGSYGMGPWSSRGAVFGASAVKRAAEKVREKMVNVSSAVLGERKEDIVLRDGMVYAKTPEGKSMSISDLCRHAYYYPGPYASVPEDVHMGDVGEYIPFEASVRWTGPSISWEPETLSMYVCITSGFEIVVVEVDPETGLVDILENTIVFDCGNVINPEIVKSQLHDTLKGMKGILQENFTYDEEGKMIADSYMDYSAPTAREAVNTKVELVETPSPFTEMGTKGMGEGPGIISPPAIVNAVEDALAPLGVRIDDAPLKPHKILEYIRSAQEGGGESLDEN